MQTVDLLPVVAGLVVLIAVLISWLIFEVKQSAQARRCALLDKTERHEFLMMLIGEWGGYRLTPGIRINDERMCAILTTPKGWLLVKYDQEYEHMFKSVPVYQNGLVNVPLDESIQKELIAQLLKKSGEDMRYMSGYRQDVGLYQSDPIGSNVHDWRGATCPDGTSDRLIYEHATSTGFERSGLSHAQKTRACDIRMDDSSAQPVKSPRCMACGEWRAGICKPGGNVIAADIISTTPVPHGVNRF